MTHAEIVRKLVGNINPAGASHIDDERFDNLRTMIDLVEELLGDIQYVTRSAESWEGSVKRSGLYAKKFIDNLKEEL